MDYQQSVNYIHSLSRFAKKNGHENIIKILDKLHNPHNGLRFIHVAGTNGKGSVCAFITSVLKEAGYKVGTFVSPFIEKFNERIQINSKPISDEDISLYTSRVKSVCDELSDVSPLEFEFITAMGFMYFKEQQCDIVVLETGLGGRLDSTNVIENPLLEVICQIGLDHTDILGNTIEEITREKAGIIKEGSKVIVYPDNDRKAYNVIEDVCKFSQSEMIVPDVNELLVDNVSCSGSNVIYRNIKLHIPLVGRHQILNALCAVEAIKNLPFDIDDDIISDGIAKTTWPCRFEIVGKDKNIILDGAHNYPGILGLKNTICDVLQGKKLVFVVGMLNDKEYKKSFDEILPLCHKLIVTSVPSIRQINADEVFLYAKKIKSDAIYIEDCFEAVNTAKSLCDKDGVVCIFGSLYLVGNLRGIAINL